MWHPRVVYLRFVTLCLLIAAAPDFILGLRYVSVTVPTAVKKGDNAHLICNYDMEGDTLYSVKWYKGRREFYRYTPKENPAMKIFTQSGITVERTLSNQSHVVLSSVEPSISGKYSCEVSADAPSFHTVIVSGDMEVVEIPEHRPSLTGIHSRYRLGDVVNGNCSSHYSKPAANLTWTINDIPATIGQTKAYDPVKSPTDNLEASVVEINFSIIHQHFIRGRLKLKCTARIHGIYEQDIEKIIEEDRPRILASGRSPDVNLFPFDQQADGELSDQNELYLTHYKADMPSSASSSSITYVRQSGATFTGTKSAEIAATTTTTTIPSSIKTAMAFDAIFYATIILLIVFINNLKNVIPNGSRSAYHQPSTGHIDSKYIFKSNQPDNDRTNNSRIISNQNSNNNHNHNNNNYNIDVHNKRNLIIEANNVNNNNFKNNENTNNRSMVSKEITIAS